MTGICGEKVPALFDDIVLPAPAWGREIVWAVQSNFGNMCFSLWAASGSMLGPFWCQFGTKNKPKIRAARSERNKNVHFVEAKRTLCINMCISSRRDAHFDLLRVTEAKQNFDQNRKRVKCENVRFVEARRPLVDSMGFEKV